MAKKLRFSAADREIIRKHSIGQPTGVKVELGGMELDLVPLTTEQAGEVFAILDAIAPLLASQDAEGNVAVEKDHWAQVVATQGDRVRKILHSVLYEAAVAGDLIDKDTGAEVFEEWFRRLPLAATLQTLFPKIIEAQGLKTMLGNSSTPPPSETTTGSTNP